MEQIRKNNASKKKFKPNNNKLVIHKDVKWDWSFRWEFVILNLYIKTY